MATATNGQGANYRGLQVRMPTADRGIFGVDDCLGILETEADGRNPATSGAVPSMPPKQLSGDVWENRLTTSGSAAPGGTSTYKVYVPWESRAPLVAMFPKRCVFQIACRIVSPARAQRPCHG
jgi:hypothetical protein